MKKFNKIVYIASAREDYSRVKLFTETLRNSKYSVTIITSKQNLYFLRFFSVILRSFYYLITSEKKTTIVIIGFMSQPLYPIVRLFWPSIIINDFFFSIYDTLVHDKNLIKQNSITSKIVKWLDYLSLKGSDVIITDTNSHAIYYNNYFNINEINKFRILPIGADDKIFLETEPHKINEKLKIAFHGNFIPLQGTEVIVRAGYILQKNKVKVDIIMIGDGQTYSETVKLAKDLKVKNIKFYGRRKLDQIMNIYESVHVGLGIFGTSNKSLRVIPNKAYEVIAMKRLLISQDSTAMREYFENKKNALLTKPGSSEDLAKTIQVIISNPNMIQNIANSGNELFKEKFANKVLAKRLLNIIEEKYE